MPFRTMGYPQSLERTRRKEYPSLADTTYLDHAGTTIPSATLMRRFASDMVDNLYGNPHSASASSTLSTKRIETARLRALRFFKADPEHFDLIFVANATAAIKLVMDAFREGNSRETDQPGFRYLYHRDSHTSLVGVRENAVHGSRCLESDEQVEGWLETGDDHRLEDNDNPLGLFAYPAQSNMNGRRLPLSWPGRLRQSPRPTHQHVYTFLDAAAFVTTGQLDLSNESTAPDFTALSFYKIFGFPDLGALIVRKRSGHLLQKRSYFGGGTVDMVISMQDKWHAQKQESLHETQEDGTLPFHSIIALDHAMTTHEQLYGSMDRISSYTASLAKLMYDRLSSLRHYTGQAVCEIYRDKRSRYGDASTQGPTVAFNIRDSQGLWMGKSEFERRAAKRGIQLRTGGMCNAGGIASSLHLSGAELRRNYTEGLRCGNEVDVLWGKPTGIIRVSLAAMSTEGDVQVLIDFMENDIVELAPPNVSLTSMSRCIHTMGAANPHCSALKCEGKVSDNECGHSLRTSHVHLDRCPEAAELPLLEKRSVASSVKKAFFSRLKTCFR